MIGRKRWAFHAPTQEHPPELFTQRPSCGTSFTLKQPRTITCDQPPGTVMWVPPGWHHETCALDEYSVGMGGLTFEGADVASEAHPGKCVTDMGGAEYQLDAIPYCRAHACRSLPVKEAAHRR